MVHFLETWGYLAIFILSFVSAMGLPAGGELAIVYGGVLASGKIPHQPHHLSLVLVIVIATLAEMLGSLVGYLIGFYGGRPLFDRFGKWALLTHRDLDRAEAWFAHHGDRIVVFGRLIPLLRSTVSFGAGLGEMAIGKFVIFSVLGCAIWCTTQASIGFAVGSSYLHIAKVFSFAGYALAVAAVIALAVFFVHRVRVVRRESQGASGALSEDLV